MNHKQALEEILSICTDNESSLELVGRIEKIADESLQQKPVVLPITASYDLFMAGGNTKDEKAWFELGYKAAKKEATEKDLIITGLEEGAEMWKREYDSAIAILASMIDVINDKPALAQTVAFAKAFLSKYQHL